MITTIIILAYVASVFLNRWMNKIIYKAEGAEYLISPKGWFIPVISTIVLFGEVLDNRNTWFTGKNW